VYITVLWSDSVLPRRVSFLVIIIHSTTTTTKTYLNSIAINVYNVLQEKEIRRINTNMKFVGTCVFGRHIHMYKAFY